VDYGVYVVSLQEGSRVEHIRSNAILIFQELPANRLDHPFAAESIYMAKVK
jgi:hypothetical protein